MILGTCRRCNRVMYDRGPWPGMRDRYGWITCGPDRPHLLDPASDDPRIAEIVKNGEAHLFSFLAELIASRG